MTDKTKKIIIISSISLVIVALIIVLWLYWPAITGTLQDEKYYTQEEMDDAVSDAYDQAIGDRNNYLSQIEYYKSQLEQTIANLSSTTQQLNELIATNSENLALIEQLNTTINSLNDQIANLQLQIQELQLKLDAYAQYEGVAVCANFYVDGTPYDVDIVNINTDYVEFPTNVVVEGCNFEGWSTDGQTVIENTSSFTIDKNTNFYAVLTCDITFNTYGTASTTKALKGTTLSSILPTVDDYENMVFEGWYIGNTKQDENMQITSHITFTAKFRKYIDITSFSQLTYETRFEDSLTKYIFIDYYNNFPFTSGFLGFLNADFYLNGEKIEDESTVELGSYKFNLSCFATIVGIEVRIESENNDLTQNDIEPIYQLLTPALSARIYDGELTVDDN